VIKRGLEKRKISFVRNCQNVSIIKREKQLGFAENKRRQNRGTGRAALSAALKEYESLIIQAEGKVKTTQEDHTLWRIQNLTKVRFISEWE